jgi:hypothetical protein
MTQGFFPLETRNIFSATLLIGIDYKKLFIILFLVHSDLAQFSPGGVHGDRRFDLLARGFSHESQ